MADVRQESISGSILSRRANGTYDVLLDLAGSQLQPGVLSLYPNDLKVGQAVQVLFGSGRQWDLKILGPIGSASRQVEQELTIVRVLDTLGDVVNAAEVSVFSVETGFQVAFGVSGLQGTVAFNLPNGSYIFIATGTVGNLEGFQAEVNQTLPQSLVTIVIAIFGAGTYNATGNPFFFIDGGGYSPQESPFPFAPLSGGYAPQNNPFPVL